MYDGLWVSGSLGLRVIRLKVFGDGPSLEGLGC